MSHRIPDHTRSEQARIHGQAADRSRVVNRPEPSPVGAQRRLQALMCRSWWPRAISQAAGIPARSIEQALQDPRYVTSAFAREVAAAYDQLWDQQPPIVTSDDRTAARAVRQNATRPGWAPPMAWDDDVIDQPDGVPAPGWKPSRRTKGPSADLVEDAEWVRLHGGYARATCTQLAMRLGVPRSRLEKAYERARLPERSPAAVGRQAEAG